MKIYKNLVLKYASRQKFLHIYDGPNIYSNELDISNGDLILSSFQATIVMLKQNLIDFQVMYSETVRNITKLSLNDTNEFHTLLFIYTKCVP